MKNVFRMKPKNICRNALQVSKTFVILQSESHIRGGNIRTLPMGAGNLCKRSRGGEKIARPILPEKGDGCLFSVIPRAHDAYI